MRASQAVAYLNRKVHPNEEESRFFFTHITFTPKLKAIRRKYRAQQKKRQKKEAPNEPI